MEPRTNERLPREQSPSMSGEETREERGDGSIDAPSDRTTLTEVVDAYRASGFATDFFAEEPALDADPDPDASGTGTNAAGPMVRCARCASVLEPGRLPNHSMRRLEGASDPADMVAVIATTCPVCGSDGTLVLSYGPMASAVDADVLVALRDERDDDVLPPAVAPAEHDTTG